MLAFNDEVDFYSFTVPSGTQTINISANEDICFSVYSISLDAGTYCLKIEKYSYACFYSFSINSPHQHSYNYAYTVKSTYTSQGYDVYTCSCGASYTTNYKAVKKLGKVNL